MREEKFCSHFLPTNLHLSVENNVSTTELFAPYLPAEAHLTKWQCLQRLRSQSIQSSSVLKGFWSFRTSKINHRRFSHPSDQHMLRFTSPPFQKQNGNKEWHFSDPTFSPPPPKKLTWIFKASWTVPWSRVTVLQFYFFLTLALCPAMSWSSSVWILVLLRTSKSSVSKSESSNSSGVWGKSHSVRVKQ